MIDSSVNTASRPDQPALTKDGNGSSSSVGKPYGWTLSLLPTASEAKNYSQIPGQEAPNSNSNSNMLGKTDSKTVTGKSLEKRTLSALNQLAAGASAMSGSAWVRGVSLYHPANLAMSLIQQVPGLVGTVCPDCPRLINAARFAADWGQAYGWANSIYAAMATGNIPAVATTTALCGASYACQNFSSNSVSQLCARFPASLREYGEPWLQAATRVAVAGALRVAETVGTSETVKKEGRRFIIPAQQDTTHPATEEPNPSVTVNQWNNPGTAHSALGTNATANALPACSKNSVSPGFSSLPILSVQAEPTAQIPINKSPPVILPANHTGHGLASLMAADSFKNDSLTPLNNLNNNNVVQPLNLEGKRALGRFLQLPLAEAGLIRSFTREQHKALLHEAAHQHLMLAPQCPDMSSATPVDNNGTVYRAESDTSGWVTIAHNQSFHYQLYSTDPVTPLAANLADGNRIPAPGILRLAHAIQDRISHQVESLPPVAELAKNVAADQLPKASAHLLTFAQPKVQSQLDPGMLSREVKNGTVLILKPCNFITGQPEASVLVLSADHQALNVQTHIGTEGFVAESSLRAKRQASPAKPIRLAPECQTQQEPGFVSGSLEVFIDGQWGTVCSSNFGTLEARVACAQLGYFRSIEYTTKKSICPTHLSKPILMHELHCNGDETSLQDCSWTRRRTQCLHKKDVALRCQLFQLSTTGCESEPGSVIGRPWVWQNGTWGSVCDEDVGDGDSICKSMGFPGGVRKDRRSCSLNANHTDPIHWAGMRCNGTEASPQGCSHNELTNNCSHDNDVVMSCKASARISPDCQTTERGYVGGRLEIFAIGQWGAVCKDYLFDFKDARVACTHLGYPGAIGIHTRVDPLCSAATGPMVSMLRCTEDESSLLDCDHWLGVDYCPYNDNPVHIRCQLFQLSTNDCHSEPGSVIGKLRVWQNGTWGSVCNQDTEDGHGICKSLGFAGGVIKNISSCPFGTDQTDPIHWAGLRCNGSETSPYGCSHHELTNNCSHDNDMVLSCKTGARISPDCQANKPGLVSGRFEVFANNQWGTICDFDFDKRNARVACTQLGYPGAIANRVKSNPSCPETTEHILFQNFACTGNELTLQDCRPYYAYLFKNQCNYSPRAIAVRCQLFQLSTNGCKSKPGSVTGKLLVWHNGTWGSVCNKDIGEGNNICKSIGFSGGVIMQDSRSCPSDTDPNQPILWAGLRCNGTEESPHSCWHHELTNNCSHKNDVVLSCKPTARLSRNCFIEEPGFVTGRLELFNYAQWGTVCDAGFDSRDARVACAQLGYSGGVLRKDVNCPAAPWDLPILMSNVGCTGDESSLQDCRHESNFAHPRCLYFSTKEVVLRCQLFHLSLNGCKSEPGSVIGRLRVWQNGTWGSVCDQDIGDGDGICKSIGFPGGVVMKDSGLCSSDTDPNHPIHWAGLRCNGTEASPHDCAHHERTNNCSFKNDVVLRCNTSARVCPNCRPEEPGFSQAVPDNPIHLAPEFQTEEPGFSQADPDNPIRLAPECLTKEPGFVSGWLEVFDNGRWGTVCGHFGTSEAHVACAQLGYTGGVEITTRENFCLRDRPILLDDVRCNGDETSLQECDHGGLGAHSCSHHEVVGVRCQIPILTTATTQKMGKNMDIIRFIVVVGGGIVASGSQALVYRNARKLLLENNDLSACQLIRKAVVITFTNLLNSCRRRTNRVQPAAIMSQIHSHKFDCPPKYVCSTER